MFPASAGNILPACVDEGDEAVELCLLKEDFCQFDAGMDPKLSVDGLCYALDRVFGYEELFRDLFDRKAVFQKKRHLALSGAENASRPRKGFAYRFRARCLTCAQ